MKAFARGVAVKIPAASNSIWARDLQYGDIHESMSQLEKVNRLLERYTTAILHSDS